jgi:uncharacterized protein YwgA
MSVLIELNKDTEILKKLHSPVEEVVFTVALLKKIGKHKIDSFNDRLYCQKTVYLANRLGISPKYKFGLYLHGPYSKDLTSDLYILKDYFDKIEPVDLASNDAKSNLDKLEKVVNSSETARNIELIATLDFFHSIEGTKEKAIVKIKEVKSAKDKEIEFAESKLCELGLW